MTFSELGIKRHVMAYMVSFAIMLFGIIGYSRIGIDESPDVDFPVIIVSTFQEGSDAELVDATITSVLLDQINGISGIDNVSGRSYPGFSSIVVRFELDKDIDVAFNEVQAKVNLAIADLPSDVDLPQLIKANSSDSPIITLTLSGDRTIQQLNLYADKIIKKQLEIINGVSEVQIGGKRDRVLRIELDLFKMSSFGVSIADIIQAINASHIQMPGGYIIGDKNELLLNLDFEAHSVEDFSNIVVKSVNGSLLKLGYIATIVDGIADFRAFSSYNSYPSVSLGVTKIVGYNAFEIEKEVKEKLLKKIQPNLQPGLQLEVTDNVVDYIKEVVASLEEHLYLGTFLTSLIVFLFLRSFIATIIVSLAIPISLLGAVFVIYAFGYTFNNITLLALLLLIGVVVDDAIIVLENIYRKMEEGLDPIKASIDGSSQVFFAVMAATLSLVSIFGPVVFMDGIIGRFFKSFAVTVTFGVMISYFVSLYITPMLCSRYLRYNHGKQPNIFYQKLESFFVIMEKGYFKILQWSLSHKSIVLIGALLVFLSSFLFFSKVPVEFAPDGDRSQFMVYLKTPQGSNIYNTLNKVAQAESIIKSNPEVKAVLADIGINAGPVSRAKLTINLVEAKKRSLSQYEVMKKIEKQLASIAGVSIIASPGNMMGGGSYKMELNLIGPNFSDLYKNALKLKDLFEANPKIGSTDLSVDNLPQLKFAVDRNQLALLKLTSKDVLQAIGVMVGGIDVNKFNSIGDDERYDIRVKGLESQLKSIDDLNGIYIKTQNNSMVRLDSVVKPIEYLGFSSIERSGQQYAISIRSNPNAPLGEALAIAKSIGAKNLSNDYSIELKGSAKELMKTINAVVFVFGVSILLLYMVLASQFNSFIQPIILMTAIPLSIVGGVGGLLISGYSMNMFSMIGLILLVGLVAKTSILLIDFTNELRQQGYSIKDALLKACPLRLRPVLMTSITVVLSMLPAMAGSGAGSESNASLSAVVVGGMISSTILTLIVVPTLYYAIENMIEYFKNKKLKKVI